MFKPVSSGGVQGSHATRATSALRIKPEVISRDWKLMRSGLKQYLPTGVNLPKQSLLGEVKGTYKLQTISAELSTGPGARAVPIFAQAGHERSLNAVGSVLASLPAPMLKAIDSVDVWTNTEKPIEGVPSYGIGFQLSDPPSDSRWGKAIVSFGGALRPSGHAVSILGERASNDRVRLLLTDSHFAARLPKSGALPHRDPAAWDAVRTGGPSPLEFLGPSETASGGRDTGLIPLLAHEMYVHLSENDRKAYFAAVEKDGGVAFAQSSNGRKVELDAASGHIDFNGALQTLSMRGYRADDFAKIYPNRFAFLKELFTR